MIYPLVHEIIYDDPVKMFSLFSDKTGAVLLDSAELRDACGRYSFIAIDPFLTLTSKQNEIHINGQSCQGDPFAMLEQQLSRFSLTFHADLPPFQGGVAGYFGYDLCHHVEKFSRVAQDDMQFPDMAVGFYDLVIGFDQVLRRAWIFSSGYPLQAIAEREQRAEQRCAWLLNELARQAECTSPVTIQTKQDIEIHANFTAASYQAAVRQVIEYILAGDIFEANISQRFQAILPAHLSAFQLYCQLREVNPAPFAAYLCFDDVVIASASPERFLQLKNQQVETRPIKGTRSRGLTAEQDQQFINDLLQSEKDHAENTMIVDLLRNDLSRVCGDHSVQVPSLCRLESYATVHHLVSVVTGKLQNEKHAIDLLRATFPGGSITGAPKIRAMEIIAEIEPTCRGPYCGSVGYIGFNGDMDTSIVIRTYAIKNNVVTFQAGGAVVADSDPLSEYEETLIKSAALRRVLNYLS
jgi:para-aminobenzoate synthetase component 1